MCALYDGAVVAAVSTLCWVAKNEAQCQARTYGVVMALVKPMQAVFVSLLPRAVFPSSPAHLFLTLSEPQDLIYVAKLRASVFRLANHRLHHRLAEAKWASCGHPWWPSR